MLIEKEPAAPAPTASITFSGSRPALQDKKEKTQRHKGSEQGNERWQMTLMTLMSAAHEHHTCRLETRAVPTTHLCA